MHWWTAYVKFVRLLYIKQNVLLYCICSLHLLYLHCLCLNKNKMQLNELLNLYCCKLEANPEEFKGLSRCLPLPTQRQVFWFICFSLGYPVRQISLLFGVTEQCIRKGVKRAQNLISVNDNIALRCYNKGMEIVNG